MICNDLYAAGIKLPPNSLTRNIIYVTSLDGYLYYKYKLPNGETKLVLVKDKQGNPVKASRNKTKR